MPEILQRKTGFWRYTSAAFILIDIIQDPIIAQDWQQMWTLTWTSMGQMLHAGRYSEALNGNEFKEETSKQPVQKQSMTYDHNAIYFK